MIYLSPSILAADKSDLVFEIQKMEEAGAQFIHLDVMDGVFVPAKTFGPELINEISNKHHMVNDVHLMIANPLEMAPAFLEAGADILTFHLEAVDLNDAFSIIDLVHEKGKRVGISIKPGTEVETLLPFMEKVDMILIMTVEPGKGGQKFMPEMLSKIKFLRENGFHKLIQVDGGINYETGKLCVESGADVLVSGSYLYGHDDYKERAEGLLSL